MGDCINCRYMMEHEDYVAKYDRSGGHGGGYWCTNTEAYGVIAGRIDSQTNTLYPDSCRRCFWWKSNIIPIKAPLLTERELESMI